MGIHTGPVAHGLDGEVFKSRLGLLKFKKTGA